MRKWEYGEGRGVPDDGKGERSGGRDRNAEKRYKKGIIIFLLTHAMTGTPASIHISKHFYSFMTNDSLHMIKSIECWNNINVQSNTSEIN